MISSLYKFFTKNKISLLVSLSLATTFSVSLGYYISYSNNSDFSLTVWPEYITSNQYDTFEKQSKLKIKEVYFESNESLLSKLNTTNFDMLVPSDYIVKAMQENNSIDKLNYQEINKYWQQYYNNNISKELNGVNYSEIIRSDIKSNYSNTWQAISPVYPIGEYYLEDYALPYQSGDIKIIYNLTDPVIQKMFNEEPDLIGSYQSFEWISNNGGSILANKNMRDFISLGQKATGNSINDFSDAAINEAYNYLANLMPNTKLQHDDLARTIAHLDSWSVAYAFPGDVVMGINDEWLDSNIDLPWYEALLFTKPQEGSVIYFDVMTQGYDSKKDSNTSEFISFLTTPEVQAGSTYDNVDDTDIKKENTSGSGMTDEEYENYYTNISNNISSYYGGVGYTYYTPSNKYVYEGYANEASGMNTYETFCSPNGISNDFGFVANNIDSEELAISSNSLLPNSTNYKNDWGNDYVPLNNTCYDKEWEEHTDNFFGDKGYGFTDEVIENWFSSPNYLNLYYQALIISTDLDNDMNSNGIYDVQEIEGSDEVKNLYYNNVTLPNGEIVEVKPESSTDMLFNRAYGDEMYLYSEEGMSKLSKMYNDLLALQNLIN